MRPDGVYFGLDEATYHADPALGSTDIRKLLISPSEWWWGSEWNPRRPADKDTPARLRGRALHKFVLEGEEAFRRAFVRGHDITDHPDALVTIDHLKAALAHYSLATTGRKEDLTRRLADRVPKLKIWDLMLAEQANRPETVLPPDVHDDVLVASAMIVKNPSLAPAFTGGMPEVSVFWTEDGTRLKARFDYLKVGAVVDLKSFTNVMDKPLESAIRNAIWSNRYDVQACHYLNARARLPGFVAAGLVHGEHDADWLARVAAYPDYKFAWVFYHVGGAPIARGKGWRRGTHSDQCAAMDIQRALEAYRSCLERFGTEMWVDETPFTDCEDEDTPAWVGR